MSGSADDDAPAEALAAEVARCTALLERLVEDRGLLAGLDGAARQGLLMAAGRLSRPERHEVVRLNRALRQNDQRGRRARDLDQLSRTGLRREKIDEAIALQRHLPGLTAHLPLLPLEPAALAPVAAVPELAPEVAPVGPGELERPRACYICKAPFTRLHHFYDALCPPCATLNFRKRQQSADLGGWVALVTGGRVKIGFQTALILLRAGARVVVTSRFPRDAARRFAAEHDAASWAPRLSVLGLDLRDVQAVELLARFLEARLGRLDLLVNNAAQTVRRPAGFYAHLLEAEQATDRGPLEADLLAARTDLEAWLQGQQQGATVGLLSPAALTQRALLPDDLVASPRLFPPGELDRHWQQVDLREGNSWRMLAEDVPTAELVEVHLVNTLAPFLLASRLRGLMARQPTGHRHVVNVSAMEAQFSRRKKTERHPHTNMAKAALNMFTRTSAADFVRSGIHMNSVDTGWVTDEDPVRDCARKQVVHEFFPPLDAIDGAARVLDPLLCGLASGVHPWGRFFKDYGEVDW